MAKTQACEGACPLQSRPATSRSHGPPWECIRPSPFPRRSMGTRTLYPAPCPPNFYRKFFLPRQIHTIRFIVRQTFDLFDIQIRHLSFLYNNLRIEKLTTLCNRQIVCSLTSYLFEYAIHSSYFQFLGKYYFDIQPDKYIVGVVYMTHRDRRPPMMNHKTFQSLGDH
jgi:hypothetical protein